MKNLLFIAFLLAPAAALAGVTFTSGGSGSVVFGRGGAGSITLAQAESCASNGLIGNSTVLDSNSRAQDVFIYSSFTVTTPGLLSHLGIRLDPVATTDDYTYAIYDTSGNLLAYKNITNIGSGAVAWYVEELNTTICTTPGQVLIIGLVMAQATSVFKDGTEAGHYRRTIPMTYATVPPSTADFSSGNFTSLSESSTHNFMAQNDATIP